MKQHALASGAEVEVPRTLWSGTDVGELAKVDLPDHWVLKPAHRSGLVYFGDRDTDFDEVAVLTRDWLLDIQQVQLAEWAYGQARPVLLVEELIGEPGSPPPDFKFFLFDGEPALVQVDLDRFSGHRRSLFTPGWEKLPVELNHPDGGPVPAPARLEAMVEAARRLGAGFDFIRIDLYLVGERIVFGEFTPYPGSGLERFRPASFDAELGARWTLPESPR